MKSVVIVMADDTVFPWQTDGQHKFYAHLKHMPGNVGEMIELVVFPDKDGPSFSLYLNPISSYFVGMYEGSL